LIRCSALLCGTATVSEALRHERDSRRLPPHLLQFSSDIRPVVVWNTTNRCNLSCEHCYIRAEDRAYKDELSNAEARAFIADVAKMQCPVLLFSGGEPLVRADMFELAAFATEKGLRPVLSTNGTLITPEVARKLRDVGMQYVGVSIDGLPDTHDCFRGRKGAFEEALAGIRNAAAAGLRTGVRFTVHAGNAAELPALLDRIAGEGVPRFCLYHLVYAGRGADMAGRDTDLATKRQTIGTMIGKALEFHGKGVEIELLTVDNHADGVFIHHYLAEREPQRAKEVEDLVSMHGGCSAGGKMANVDPYGNVHPCQFWGHLTLGNVREREFSEIWNDPENEFLQQLRNKEPLLKGRCGACSYRALCGGCRVRAEAVTGDLWEADPACYLTDAEIEAVVQAE
jgi:radical SAM protein with 4Fe4S-binding SPASM domain